MQIPSTGPVVVGVGDPSADAAAIRLAAREATSRGRMLLVVHAFRGPADAGYGPARRIASQIVDEAVSTAQRSTPGAEARGQLVDGPPGPALTRLSRSSVLVVLGGPRTEVAARSWCPVAVARTLRTPAGPVVAAVDGSPWSVPVLRFAAEAAARRGGPVYLVHVTDSGSGRVLDEVLAQVPEVTAVRRRLPAGRPAAVLVRLSRRAGLLVIGPRGTAAAGRLGTVADEVLRRSGCPAVVVHGTHGGSAPWPGPDGRFQEAR